MWANIVYFGLLLKETRRHFDRPLGTLQNQLQNPYARNPDESNETFDARFDDGYYSITVADHRLIIVIRFVAKNKTTSIPEQVLQIDSIQYFMRSLEEAFSVVTK